MEEFLQQHGVLFKQLKPFVLRQAERLKVHARAVAAQAGRPWQYLEAPVRKDQHAISTPCRAAPAGRAGAGGRAAAAPGRRRRDPLSRSPAELIALSAGPWSARGAAGAGPRDRSSRRRPLAEPARGARRSGHLGGAPPGRRRPGSGASGRADVRGALEGLRSSAGQRPPSSIRGWTSQDPGSRTPVDQGTVRGTTLRTSRRREARKTRFRPARYGWPGGTHHPQVILSLPRALQLRVEGK